MRKRKGLKRLFVLLLLLIAVLGALLIARPHFQDEQRESAEDILIQKIQEGEHIITLPDIPEVEGESFDELEEIAPEYLSPDQTGDEENAQDANQEPKTVVGYGLIEIPVIELEMPVVQGADTNSLRAAVGWWPESAPMGSAGNCVIFGHRMVTYGRHFNRLDEVKENDLICLYNTDGNAFQYKVVATEVIAPADLMSTLYAHNEGYGLTLVTCTPTGVGSHRLLVYAQLDTPETGEE